MTLECDAKFEEKLTCGLENDMRNLANFQMYELKNQRGLMRHDNEECKI